MPTTQRVAIAHGTGFPSASQVFDVEAADAEASGCAKHSDPECLCDVVIDEPVAIVKPPVSLLNVDSGAEFAEWAAPLAAGMEMGLDFDGALEAREKFERATNTEEFCAALRASIEAGLTLGETVNLWGISPTELVRRWHSNGYVEDGQRWLDAEELMATTLLSYAEIGRRVELSYLQVKTLSELLICEGRSPRRVYLDYLQELARELRSQGWTGQQIADHVNAQFGESIGKDRVYAWLRPDRQLVAA